MLLLGLSVSSKEKKTETKWYKYTSRDTRSFRLVLKIVSRQTSGCHTIPFAFFFCTFLFSHRPYFFKPHTHRFWALVWRDISPLILALVVRIHIASIRRKYCKRRGVRGRGERERWEFLHWLDWQWRRQRHEDNDECLLNRCCQLKWDFNDVFFAFCFAMRDILRSAGGLRIYTLCVVSFVVFCLKVCGCYGNLCD